MSELITGMTRREKLRVIRDHTGHATMMQVVDWLIDAQILHLRRLADPKFRRGPTQPSSDAKEEKR